VPLVTGIQALVCQFRMAIQAVLVALAVGVVLEVPVVLATCK
jgi:hypothetical protein